MKQFLSTPSARRATFEKTVSINGVKQFLSTPSARRATVARGLGFTQTKFLSTPSARRATLSLQPKLTCRLFLSTPSARRATPRLAFLATAGVISIHALREEGDPAAIPRPRTHQPISIHALREEGDLPDASRCPAGNDFYPRPPRGGRRCPAGHTASSTTFLSTPSARRATKYVMFRK